MRIFIDRYLSGHFREIFFLLSLVLGMLTLQFVDDEQFSFFQYQQDDILSGQLWRLVSGHFVHVTWSHFALNLAGLFLVWLFFKDILTLRTWMLLTLGSIVGIDIGLLVFHPEIKWYMGLSGVLHGYFAGGAILQLRSNAARGWILLILLLSKLAWEQLGGPLPGSGELSGARVITEAHLYGAIGGLIVALYLKKLSAE